jgi:hypothetical protein
VEKEVMPIASQPVARLCEAVRKTRAWVDEVTAAKAPDGSLALGTAEELLERAGKLPMGSSMRTWLQEAVESAREVREVIRAQLVPSPPLDALLDAAPDDAAPSVTPTAAAEKDAAAGNAQPAAPDTAGVKLAVEPPSAAPALVCAAPLADRDFRALQQQAAALTVKFPELAAIDEAAAAVAAWKERVRVATNARTDLDALRALAEDANALPVACGEAEALAGTITAAQKWIAQVRCARTRAPRVSRCAHA